MPSFPQQKDGSPPDLKNYSLLDSLKLKDGILFHSAQLKQN